MIKNKFILSLLVGIFVLSIFPSMISAYSQILGKKDAPGQQKKQETDINVGTVDRVSPGKVKIKTHGKSVEVTTNKNTKIIDKPSGKVLSPGQIKKNDKIATFSSEATGSADLILVKSASPSASLQKKRRAVYGLVRSIDGNNIVVSHPIKDNPRYTIQVTGNTFIKIKGLVSATIADINLNDRLTAVGNWDGDVLVVKRIHVIPGRAIGLFEKIATESATPSATASATPSGTPSASPLESPLPSVAPSP